MTRFLVWVIPLCIFQFDTKKMLMVVARTDRHRQGDVRRITPDMIAPLAGHGQPCGNIFKDKSLHNHSTKPD